MNILLINPFSQYDSVNYSFEPNLGLLAIYSLLPESFKKEATILDGAILPSNEIKNEINLNKPKIVAISCNSFNYSIALEYCNEAKKHGATTILGGVHITNSYKSIIRNKSVRVNQIDYLHIGALQNDFSFFIHEVLKGTFSNSYSNILYLPDSNKDSEIIPIPNNYFLDSLDYSNTNFNDYSKFFTRRGNLERSKIIGSTFTQIGCPQNIVNRRCSFCSVPQKHFYRDLDKILIDIKHLTQNHNVDHIRITDPDFLTNKERLSDLIKSLETSFKSYDTKPSFYCFTRADNIDQNIKIIKSLNIVSTFIGYESGSNKMLKRFNKNITAAKSIEATRLLQENNVDVTLGSFIIGGIKESKDTLKETLSFLQKLSKIGNVRSILISPMIPYPGSNVFDRLLSKLEEVNRQEYEKIYYSDDYDLNELIVLWNRYFTNVGIEDLRKTIEDAYEIIPLGMRYLKI